MKKVLLPLLFAALMSGISCTTTPKKNLERVPPPEKLWFAFYDKGLEFKADISNDGTPDKGFYYELLTWVPPIPDKKYPQEESFLVSRYVGEGFSPFGKLILSRHTQEGLIIVGDINGDKKLDGRFHYSMSSENPNKGDSLVYFVLKHEKTEDF